MKTLTSFLLAVAGLLILQPATSRADVDFGFFYDELSPYGDWVEIDDYGYCFQPYVDNGWRPYTDGYWADSDEGWLWVSNEPYGWATYHYGRWANVTNRGWVWVPGYDWGPGWVSWRESNDYVGWAPLPPQVAYRPQSGIRFGVSFGFGDVGPGYYNFVRPRDFGYGRMRDYVLPYDRNVGIIQQTTNITNITSVVNNNQTVVYNYGPDRDFLRGRSANPIRRLNIQREGRDLTAAQLRDRRLRNQLEGDNYRVVAPRVRHGANAKPKKVAARLRKSDINDGYDRIADQKRAARVKNRIEKQAKNPKNQKKIAAKAADRKKNDAPKNDKLAAKDKRDRIVNRQKELENKPKPAAARERNEREVAAQKRLANDQANRNAGRKTDKAAGTDRNGKAAKKTGNAQSVAKKSNDRPDKQKADGNKGSKKSVAGKSSSKDKPKAASKKKDAPKKSVAKKAPVKKKEAPKPSRQLAKATQKKSSKPAVAKRESKPKKMSKPQSKPKKVEKKPQRKAQSQPRKQSKPKASDSSNAQKKKKKKN